MTFFVSRVFERRPTRCTPFIASISSRSVNAPATYSTFLYPLAASSSTAAREILSSRRILILSRGYDVRCIKTWADRQHITDDRPLTIGHRHLHMNGQIVNPFGGFHDRLA